MNKGRYNEHWSIGDEIATSVCLIGIVAAIIFALTSCTRNDLKCDEGYTLAAYTPSYLTCDVNQQTFTYQIDTSYIPISDECECQHHLNLLNESFWELVESQPPDEQFMFYQVPAEYYCIKN